MPDVQFAPHIGSRTEPGWATPQELAGPRLQEALDWCGASLGTDRRDIQGQRLVEIVAWYLALPAAGALLTGGRFPDLRTGNVRVWIGDDPPGGIGTALREQGAHPADEAACVAGLRAALIEHLAPLVDAVNAATRRPASALWRGMRDRVAGAFVWVGEQTGLSERCGELARAAVAGPVELRTLDEQLLHVREGCCLYYRCDAGTKCLSCPLLDDEARRRLLAAL